MSEPSPSNPLAALAGKKHGVPLGPVPVFNCIVIVSPKNSAGRVQACVANLPEISAEAASERDALQQIVADFKRIVGQRHAAGQPIAWQEPPLQPGPGEQQRLIAVHL